MFPKMICNKNSTVLRVTFCFGEETEVCMPLFYEALIIGLYALSLLLNIAHIAVLCRLRKMKGTVFHKLLITTSVLDILDAFMKISTFACSVRVIGMENWTMVCALVSMIDIIAGARSLMQCAAIIDRWLSLARPYEYASIFFIKRFNSTNGFALFVLAALIAFKNAYCHREFCLAKVIGFIYSPKSIEIILMLVLFLINFIVVNVFVFLIGLNLREMRLRSWLSEDDRLLQQAAKYAVVTYILHFICMFGYLIFFLHIARMFSMTLSFNVLSNFMMFSAVLSSCYGSLNIVTFAWYTSGYRNEIRKICGIQPTQVGVN